MKRKEIFVPTQQVEPSLLIARSTTVRHTLVPGFGSAWFLDLPYSVVAIGQVLNRGDTHRTRQHVCPAGSPGTVGSFAGVRSCDANVLWFIFLCTVPMYHTVLG